MPSAINVRIEENLGPVTAYSYAKAHGYTGTEADFQAEIGSSSINAQAAAASAAQAIEVRDSLPLEYMELSDTVEALVQEKASANELAALYTEVDQTKRELDAFEEHTTNKENEVDESIQSVEDRLVTKAEANDLAAIVIEHDMLQNHFNQLQDIVSQNIEDISNHEDRLTEAEQKIEMKAEANDLAAVVIEVDLAHTELDNHEARVVDIEQKLPMKAEANDIAALAADIGITKLNLQALDDRVKMKAEANDIAAITIEMDSKADAQEIKDQLDIKANINDLAAVAADVDRLETTSNKQANTISGIQGAIADVQSEISGRIPKPSITGTAGQVLMADGSGGTNWGDPTRPTDTQIGNAVSEWLDEHPDATTTVADGSITEEKLAPEVLDLIGTGEDKDAQVLANSIYVDIQAKLRENPYIEENLLAQERYRHILKKYANRFLSNGAGFIFFTDPHNLSPLFGATDKSLLEDLRYIRLIYEHTPARYVFCGGDWLNVDHTLYDATWMVGRVQNLLRTEICPNAFTVYGNHDNNSESVGQTSIAKDKLARIWYGTDKLYWVIEELDCDIYMLDLDYSVQSVSEYQWQELDWLANKLLANTKLHLFGVGHILIVESPYFGDAICSLLNAFNQKVNITLNNKLYDFSSTFGTWHFIIGGHAHSDTVRTQNNIPLITTDDFATTKAVDLCYADFDHSMLYLTRIGQGEDREIPIIPTNGYKVAD